MLMYSQILANNRLEILSHKVRLTPERTYYVRRMFSAFSERWFKLILVVVEKKQHMRHS